MNAQINLPTNFYLSKSYFFLQPAIWFYIEKNGANLKKQIQLGCPKINEAFKKGIFLFKKKRKVICSLKKTR